MTGPCRVSAGRRGVCCLPEQGKLGHGECWAVSVDLEPTRWALVCPPLRNFCPGPCLGLTPDPHSSPDQCLLRVPQDRASGLTTHLAFSSRPSPCQAPHA